VNIIEEAPILSRSGIHAVRALIVLAQAKRGDYIGTIDIAKQTGAPGNYLGKLLSQLARSGLVQSQRGLGGGFRLAKLAGSISLFDVVSSLEDIGRWNNCILGNPVCSDEDPCAVHNKWSPVRDSYLVLLETTRLSDITPAGLEEDG
jgi:Rrf2 family iron-sulfur cluster assembly transcriptional regulator